MTKHTRFVQTKSLQFGRCKMAEFKIRITDESLIKALDKIVSDENYESRNQLVVHILTLYCSCRDKFIINSLPSIVNNLCQETITQTAETTQKLLEIFAPVLAEIDKKLNEIEIFIKNDI